MLGLLELIEEPSGKQISEIIILLLQPLQTGNEFYDRYVFLVLASCLDITSKYQHVQSKVYVYFFECSA